MKKQHPSIRSQFQCYHKDIRENNVESSKYIAHYFIYLCPSSILLSNI